MVSQSIIVRNSIDANSTDRDCIQQNHHQKLAEWGKAIYTILRRNLCAKRSKTTYFEFSVFFIIWDGGCSLRPPGSANGLHSNY